MSEDYEHGLDDDQAHDDGPAVVEVGPIGTPPREPSRRWPMTGPPTGA